MATTKIYLGLHGACGIGDNEPVPNSAGNLALDDLGARLGGVVYPWGAATTPDPNDFDPYWTKQPPRPRSGLYPGHPGYLPSRAVKYLIARISAAMARGDDSSVRLFGWSTGAVMLCRVAESLWDCPVIEPAERRQVELCLAIDPLWSLAALGQFPEIPDNVSRWVCLRQNRNGDSVPTENPADPAFWEGVRLAAESPADTQYSELNVPLNRVVGNPGFMVDLLAIQGQPVGMTGQRVGDPQYQVSTDPMKVTHGQMPIIADADPGLFGVLEG